MTSVLDSGEVILIDHMASDGKVTGAARVSTGKGPEFVSKGEEQDRKLIGFLMANHHGTPFEHAVFQWFIKAPIFVVREWQRHRVASYNEFSLRYAEVGEETAEFYVPDLARVPDPNNKQSSIVASDDMMDALVQYQVHEANNLALTSYRLMIERGVAREMARLVLPVNLYTKFWFTINARSLMNFLSLRNAPAAQWEIRQFAMALEKDFAQKMPWTYKAFIDNGRVAP